MYMCDEQTIRGCACGCCVDDDCGNRRDLEIDN